MFQILYDPSTGCVCLVRLVAPGTHTTGPKNHSAKHRLRTQNITNNFCQARSTPPMDGS